MQIDIISIFPGFFQVLDLSLIGKASNAGIINTRVHDLREYTRDRHRSVDDSPYGGGAGMVMRPEPWGEAIDAVLQLPGVLEPRLLVPTPAGRLFSQPLARELATASSLIFACGRYEGIDDRVPEHYRSRLPVYELSLGDYVLNGGEVAVLTMIEAVARLVPGVVGNPQSLVEESHEGGMLEYPNYTKPAAWRGLEVPPVLLSGDHGAISNWRRQARLERTRELRPDLLDGE